MRLVFVFLFVSLKVSAATYYFAANGDDSRTSTQAQNPATPWRTISKLNSFFSSLQPGDRVLFNRGDTFTGGIVTNKSGTLGNEIVLSYYGVGADPVISGLTTVTSWTNIGNGIYESNTLTAGATVNMVLIGGREYAMGRTPNANAANGGYLNYESHGASSITDNTNPFANTYNGAELVLRTEHYLSERKTITGISGNTISFSGGLEGSLRNNWGYFVQNDIKTLDQLGEWYYNPSTNKISVYFGGAVTQTTQVATQNILCRVDNSYITIDGLHFKGANTYGIYCDNVTNTLLVNNCTIEYSGIDGISLAGKQNFILDSSTINYANSVGVSVGFANVNPIIINSTIKNIATLQGMLKDDDRLRYGFGIYSNEGLYAADNIITNMGFIGINAEGSNNLMQHNYVDTFCTVLDDGAGLYMFNYDGGSGASVVTNNYILDNVVLHGIGAGNGTDNPSYTPAEGIYLDDNVTNVTVARNTSAYNANFGLYLHNDSGYVIRENVFFDNGSSQIGFQKDVGSFEFENGIVNRNQLFSIDAARILYYGSTTNTFFDFADLDSNWYCRPLNTNNIIQTNWFSNATTNYNLSTWQSASGHDAHTLQTPVPVTSVDKVLFIYNETKANKNFNLGAFTYKSVPGVDYSGSITLAPFTSAILLNTGEVSGGDTTYITYTTQHDTLMTTTIPDQIIGRDTTYTVFDTTYNAYYDFRVYAQVDGSVSVTETLFDTIPAHDTTFVCSSCASHDTTKMVVVPETGVVWNGMLDNHVTGATTAQEIAYVLAHSCNTMRTSYDPTRGGWPTTQIHDAGLVSFMTYNTAPVQQPSDAFPTAAELPGALNTFGQILRDHEDDLPEIISFQNEEANLSYWDGPVTDYLNWLNPAVDSAHKYGVLATNGGILHNFIYYIRWVYQQEGKTDSVNLINQRAKINANTGTAAQAVIDWYKIEIPALAASRIDYVNLHWYEPVFGVKDLNPNSDTTTGLLPIAIRFLASRTGKPVLTNEFGTDNASQTLFNRTADEWDQNGVKIRVYYAGDGNVAEEHSDYWKAWIDAHSP